MTNSANSQRIVFGSVLFGIGALLLLGFSLRDWWPVIIIAFGVMSLLQSSASRLGGLIATAVGAALLLGTLDIVSWDIGRYWPVLLLIVGAVMIFGGVSRGKGATSSASGASGDSELDVACFFGGSEQQVTSQAFRGGKISATFGGAEIDMRGASLAGGEAAVHVTTLFGGVELRVPDDWAVNVQTSNMFGGVDTERVRPAEPKAQLTITGSCTFGGLTIRS